MQYTTGYRYPSTGTLKSMGGTYNFEEPQRIQGDTDELYALLMTVEPYTVLRNITFENSVPTSSTVYNNINTPNLPLVAFGDGEVEDFIFPYTNSGFLTPSVLNSSVFSLLLRIGESGGDLGISNGLRGYGFGFSINALATIISANVKIRGYRVTSGGTFFAFIDSMGIDVTYSLVDEIEEIQTLWWK